MSEKVYRPLVLIMLFLILVAQIVIPALTIMYVVETPSNDCLAAIAAADSLLQSQASIVNNLMDNYEEAVYKRAENLPQQQFLATENQFFALQLIALQNSVLLKLTTACHVSNPPQLPQLP